MRLISSSRFAWLPSKYGNSEQERAHDKENTMAPSSPHHLGRNRNHLEASKRVQKEQLNRNQNNDAPMPFEPKLIKHIATGGDLFC